MDTLLFTRKREIVKEREESYSNTFIQSIYKCQDYADNILEITCSCSIIYILEDKCSEYSLALCLNISHYMIGMIFINMSFLYLAFPTFSSKKYNQPFANIVL